MFLEYTWDQSSKWILTVFSKEDMVQYHKASCPRPPALALKCRVQSSCPACPTPGIGLRESMWGSGGECFLISTCLGGFASDVDTEDLDPGVSIPRWDLDWS